MKEKPAEGMENVRTTIGRGALLREVCLTEGVGMVMVGRKANVDTQLGHEATLGMFPSTRIPDVSCTRITIASNILSQAKISSFTHPGFLLRVYLGDGRLSLPRMIILSLPRLNETREVDRYRLERPGKTNPPAPWRKTSQQHA